MNDIRDCLSDTKTQSLGCMSENGISSECTCMQEINGSENIFQITNINLYADSSIADMINFNNTDDWNDVYMQKMKNCFKLDLPFLWWCGTNSKNFNKTHCICYSSTNYLDWDEGFVATKSLYKGLENFTFPVIQKVNHKKPVKLINAFNNDDFTLQFDRENQYFEDSFGIAIFFMIGLIILFIIFANLSKKNIFHRKEQKNDDETLLFELFDDHVI